MRAAKRNLLLIAGSVLLVHFITSLQTKAAKPEIADGDYELGRSCSGTSEGAVAPGAQFYKVQVQKMPIVIFTVKDSQIISILGKGEAVCTEPFGDGSCGGVNPDGKTQLFEIGGKVKTVITIPDRGETGIITEDNYVWTMDSSQNRISGYFPDSSFVWMQSYSLTCQSLHNVWAVESFAVEAPSF